MIDSLCGMSKTFRSWDVDQVWLLPPSIHDFVPSGHAAHFVRESLDLSAILDVYLQARGQPPYHPMMMTALLLYAYSTGAYSSRRIARSCEEHVDFMAVTGLQKPATCLGQTASLHTTKRISSPICASWTPTPRVSTGGRWLGSSCTAIRQPNPTAAVAAGRRTSSAPAG